jgi:hypothetical protein
MISFHKLNGMFALPSLKQAINEEDLPEIVRILQIPKLEIPSEICLMLANYLDPDSPASKERKMGCKPRTIRNKKTARSMIISYYRTLCKDPERARFFLNDHREIFELVNDEDPHDENGKFAPIWKYPTRERSRKLLPFPKDEEIRDLLCKWFRISPRTFSDLLKNENEKVVKQYQTLVQEKGWPPEEAKQAVCEFHSIKPGNFNKTLAKNKNLTR